MQNLKKDWKLKGMQKIETERFAKKKRTETERYKKMETKMDARGRIYMGNSVIQMSVFQNYRIF